MPTRILLLPNRKDPPVRDEIIQKVYEPSDEISADWQPNLKEPKEIEEAFAFPTSLAWPEVMKVVLDPQASFDTHPQFKLYEQILLGLILGYLQLDIYDLLEEKSGQFGKVLVETDEQYRYFGLLRGAKKTGDMEGKVFGATSPDTLFWPSPRRTEPEWRKLKDMIGKDSNQSHAYQLLADFRSLLKDGEQWHPDQVLWMNGLDRLIGKDRQPEPGSGYRHFYYHSRFVGPILADFGEGQLKPLYIPIYEERFAANFLKTLTGIPKQENESIGIYIQNIKHSEIRMPSVRSDGSLILAGAGAVQGVKELDESEGSESTKIRYESLFKLIHPLYESLSGDQVLHKSSDGTIHKSPGNAVEDIKGRPYFYPDVFRIAVARLGEAAGPNTDVSYSDQAYKLAFKPESPGLPLESEVNEIPMRSEAWVVKYPDPTGATRRAIYIDSYGGSDIGDLKALGWVLWSYFIGHAEYKKTLDTICESDALTPILKNDSSGRPLDPTDWVYKMLSREDHRSYRKLATLQRFIKAYDLHEGKEDSNPIDKSINTLCYRAALAFVRWAWPEDDVLENGSEPDSWRTYKIGEFNITLARDVTLAREE